MKIALGQINSVVGDIDGNKQKILTIVEKYKDCDLVIFPELSLIGYPPQDLLFNDNLIEKQNLAIEELKQLQTNILLGCATSQNNTLYNQAKILGYGEEKYYYTKKYLPNYGVFDEKRYFSPYQNADLQTSFKYKNINISIVVCEDIWEKKYVNSLTKNSDLLIAINASPFYIGRQEQREKYLQKLAKNINTPIAYINLVGGQDELVFDGASFIVQKNGEIVAKLKSFAEDDRAIQLDKTTKINQVKTSNDNLKDIYSALCLGLKDYVTKNGFSSVYIGISGGIDSAICAKIAVDAVGKDRVFGVMMPFTYTSQESLDDAKSLAKNLGINYNKITINSIFTSIWNLLYREIKLSNQASVELAKQNLQARIRGMLLSTLSNLTPASMILNTSNKSEIAVGYSTIYGDMVGGFSPIKDVKKTLVYKLCEYINTHKEIIPNSIIVKEPSAELADNQKDSDNLPDYEILDRVLENIISNKTSSTEKEILVKVEKLVRNSEWKRFQSPPGTRITDISLTNLDWRLPITNRFGKDI